ncbi:UDP-N-acetylmuramate dehydrogenase [Cognatitamlana onchidii]|uniref:UDP-N-acetylmuramate dehydrogenase n=1 Tax=Cognatitamlana onchidii TaxID=2562860 RepID=UPI0010A5AE7D|nr:UDP-N-acetylmuramate dehydrogenase [Algibacter onchidii]
MHIEQNISLKHYNTFGIDVVAKYFISIKNITELKEVLSLEGYDQKLILGGGSNILLTKNFDGLVINNNIKGIEIVSENQDFVYVKANAGENWHDFVSWCINRDYGGVENLSLIPGNVGTAPIQNIGAYGVELKDVFESCQALNKERKKLESFDKDKCDFGYRNSIFKQQAKGEYIITSVTFKLTKHSHILNIDYGVIALELDKKDLKTPSIKDVSEAVIRIRESKLPNPKEIGNSGSFFKNPVISKTQYQELLNNFSDMPCYTVSDNKVKVPAGWLIEKSGFKGKTFGNYGVHKKQALVLVNYGGAKGSDILKLSELIQKTVSRIFSITLEAEVNIL